MNELIPLKEFNRVIKENFDKFLALAGFEFELENIGEYYCSRIYRKNNQYIVIDAGIHPLEGPPYWNILMGEGSAEWPECDWNKVALWHFTRKFGQLSAQEFSLAGVSIEKFLNNVKLAKSDLEKYGKSFMEGDLLLFYEIRNSINKDKVPITIYSKGKDGKPQAIYDAGSEKLKKKFSAC